MAILDRMRRMRRRILRIRYLGYFHIAAGVFCLLSKSPNVYFTICTWIILGNGLLGVLGARWLERKSDQAAKGLLDQMEGR